MAQIPLEAILNDSDRKQLSRATGRERNPILEELLGHDLEQFLIEANSPDSRVKLFQLTGVPPGVFERWAIQADLLRLNDMEKDTLGLDDANFLLDAGIDGLAGLKRSTPERLTKHLMENRHDRSKGDIDLLCSRLDDALDAARRAHLKIHLHRGAKHSEITSSHNLLIVSDLHVGEGWNAETHRVSPNEDFLYDEAFANFLAYHQSERESERGNGTLRDRPWRLIINGDFVDFLQVTSCPSRTDRLKYRIEEYSPGSNRWGLGSTEIENVWRAARIYEGHPVFFRALAWFLAFDKETEIVIQTGNHDIELIWEEVRAELRECVLSASHELVEASWRHLFSTFELGDSDVFPEPPHSLDTVGISERLAFTHWLYYQPGVALVEHGCQYETANSWGTYFDPRYVGSDVNLGGKNSDEPDRLLWPWGSLLVRYLFNRVEHTHPFADQMKPVSRYFTWAFSNHPFTMLRLLFGSARGLSRTIGQAWQRGAVEGWLGSSNSLSTLLSMTVRGFKTAATWSSRLVRRKWRRGRSRLLEWPVFDWPTWKGMVERSEQSVNHLSQSALDMHQDAKVVEDQVLIGEYGGQSDQDNPLGRESTDNAWSFLNRLLEFLLQFGVIFSIALATRSIMGWHLVVPKGGVDYSIRTECGFFIRDAPRALFDFMSGWLSWALIVGFIVVVPLILLYRLNQPQRPGRAVKLIASALAVVSLGVFVHLLFRVWCNLAYFLPADSSSWSEAVAWPQWLGWIFLLVVAFALPSVYQVDAPKRGTRNLPVWQLLIYAFAPLGLLLGAIATSGTRAPFSTVWAAWGILIILMFVLSRLGSQTALLFLFLWAVTIGSLATLFAVIPKLDWLPSLLILLLPIMVVLQKWRTAAFLVGAFVVLTLSLRYGAPVYEEYVRGEMGWEWLPIWAFWGALGLWAMEGKNNPYEYLGLQGVQSWWVRVLDNSATLSMESGLALMLLGLLAQLGLLLDSPDEFQVLGVALVLVVVGLVGRRLYHLAQLESRNERFVNWLAGQGRNDSSKLLGFGLGAATSIGIAISFGPDLLDNIAHGIISFVLLLAVGWAARRYARQKPFGPAGLVIAAYSKGLLTLAALFLLALAIRVGRDRPYGSFIMSRDEHERAALLVTEIDAACFLVQSEIGMIVPASQMDNDSDYCEEPGDLTRMVLPTSGRDRAALISRDSGVNARIENLDRSTRVLESLGVWEKTFFIAGWAISSLFEEVADPSHGAPIILTREGLSHEPPAVRNTLSQFLSWRLDQLRALNSLSAAIEQRKTVQFVRSIAIIALVIAIAASAAGVYASRARRMGASPEHLGSREQLRRLTLLARRNQRSFALGLGQWLIVGVFVLFGIGLVVGPAFIVAWVISSLKTAGAVAEAASRGDIVLLRQASESFLRAIGDIQSEVDGLLRGGIIITLVSFIGRWILSQFSRTLPIGGGYLSKVAREIYHILGQGTTDDSMGALRPVPYIMFGHDHHPAVELLNSDGAARSNEKGFRQWYGNTGAWVQAYSGDIQYRHEDEGHSVFARIIPGPDTTGFGAPLTLRRWDHAAGRPAKLDHLVETDQSREE